MAAKKNNTLKTISIIVLGYVGYKYIIPRLKASPVDIPTVVQIQDHVAPIEELIIDPIIDPIVPWLPPEKMEVEKNPTPDPIIHIQDQWAGSPINTHIVTVPIKHEIVNPGFTSASQAHKMKMELEEKKLKSKTFIDDMLNVRPTLTNKVINVTPKEQVIKYTSTVARKPLIVVKQNSIPKSKEIMYSMPVLKESAKVEELIHRMPAPPTRRKTNQKMSY